MSVWQVWLLVGFPSLVVGLWLLVKRSPWRALAAYVVLLAGFAVVVTVDPVSAALFGGILALLYATGRGSRTEGEPTGPDVVPDVAEDHGHGHVGTS